MESREGGRISKCALVSSSVVSRVWGVGRTRVDWRVRSREGVGSGK